MALYALNLFDLSDNDLYRQYSRRSVAAVGKHAGKVVALGRLDDAVQTQPGVEPRTVMVLVEWPSREAFDAFLEDPEHHDLHPLRERGTQNYLWWTYERLEDLRPLLKREFAGADLDHSSRNTGDRLRARIVGTRPLRSRSSSHGGAFRKP